MKNIDYIIKSVAAEKNLPEDQVAKVINFYWKDLKKELYKVEQEALFVRHLGTFQITNALLQREAKRLIKKIKNNEHYPERVKGWMAYLKALLKIREKVSKTYYGKFNRTILEK